MDSIENDIKQILDGKCLSHVDADFCDHSLEDQIKELAVKGIESSITSDYVPRVQCSVCYIVAAVIFNDNNEILMMQEAKESCAGTWYLPAGRVDPGEDLCAAVQREVLEETGLNFDPMTLILVESSKGNWYRFVFTGKVTGGQLKTVAHADAESLQAQWIKEIKQLDLRSTDIVLLIEKGRQYYKPSNNLIDKTLLPSIRPHHKLLLRIVVMIRKKENNRVHVLVSEKGSPHLPICEINPMRSLFAALKKFMQAIFGTAMPEHKPNGVLSIEYSGEPAFESDGLCLCLLVSCRGQLEQATPNASFTWLQVDPEIEGLLLDRIKNWPFTLVQR